MDVQDFIKLLLLCVCIHVGNALLNKSATAEDFMRNMYCDHQFYSLWPVTNLSDECLVADRSEGTWGLLHQAGVARRGYLLPPKVELAIMSLVLLYAVIIFIDLGWPNTANRGP